MNVTVNKDVLQGKWKQMKGKVKQQWGKLTDDQLNQINGSYEELAGLRKMITDEGLVLEAIENFLPVFWSDILLRNKGIFNYSGPRLSTFRADTYFRSGCFNTAQR